MGPRDRLGADDLAGLERHEIVNGELVQKASPSFEHGSAQRRLGTALDGFDGPARPGWPGGWWLATEVEIELAPHEVYLPDMAGWRMDVVPEPPRGRPVRTAPAWVCEILSPSTASRDLNHKLRTYHRAGIGHYWIVDPLMQTLTVYRRQADGYMLASAAGAGDVVRAEPFDAIDIDIGYLFGLPPREPSP